MRRLIASTTKTPISGEDQPSRSTNLTMLSKFAALERRINRAAAANCIPVSTGTGHVSGLVRASSTFTPRAAWHSARKARAHSSPTMPVYTAGLDGRRRAALHGLGKFLQGARRWTCRRVRLGSRVELVEILRHLLTNAVTNGSTSPQRPSPASRPRQAQA